MSTTATSVPSSRPSSSSATTTAAGGNNSSSSSNDDPEKLLNEWLGELENIIGDLDLGTKSVVPPIPPAKPIIARSPNKATNSRNTEFNRFSMANLEETELDAILGELNLLEMGKHFATGKDDTIKRRGDSGSSSGFVHQRSNSIVSSSATSTISSVSDQLNLSLYNPDNGGGGVTLGLRESRTESPDNDSAFSDTVSLLSSDTSSTSSGLIHNPSSSSSASSTASSAFHRPTTMTDFSRSINLSEFDNQKAAKIHLALQKLEQASVRRLFVKAFTADGASKSLLVDETMTCGHVTRLLADKNHVQMEASWALVEQLPDIQMERLYEDHELLVDKLMLWNRDSKNKILFVERHEKIALFLRPDLFIQDLVNLKEHDDSNRNFILEEFFNTNGTIPLEGPLYLKADSKKGWKRYYFVLRGSGLYYFPKEKTRSSKDLVCLGLFNDCEVYKGFGWKKKYKAPTDFTFILHSSNELANSKTTKPLKILCADDIETLERWNLAVRVAKYGKKLWTSYKALEEELAREDLDKISTRRSSSINSILATQSEKMSSSSSSNSGRLSRASSSSSSGCLSDENGFDCDFPTGTIKRKPSMKPNLPLTSMTRQLKEVGENRSDGHASPLSASPERGGTLTRSHQHIRQRSVDSGGSAGSGSSTLKRRPIDRKEKIIMSPSTCSQTETKVKEDLVQSNIVLSPLKSMPSCMTDSLFSLPPPPDEVDSTLMGSSLSLDSLPPPPAPYELEESIQDVNKSNITNASTIRNVIYQGHQGNFDHNQLPPPPPPPSQQTMQAIKKVELESCLKKGTEKIYSKPAVVIRSPVASLKSAEIVSSPVTLRKKVCFEDQVVQQQPLQSPTKRIVSSSSSHSSLPPPPPPRSDATRLSTMQPGGRMTSPGAAAGVAPSNDFLKDLQRVMRKKWQVAQKCKEEPQTNPHEVLGFRDFNELNSVPYYRDGTNVSNWVQEHYGPDSLYENLGVDLPDNPPSMITMMMQKKRPPPPPPKRSETTQLTMSDGRTSVQPMNCFNS